MANESIILFENSSLFSPISQLNYEFYTDKNSVLEHLKASHDLQCTIGHGYIPFGEAQTPSVNDYADGIDTLNFLINL